jgi:outer membrane scaffolding protein for murein synthesis (MipA/OmpV family)
LALVSTILISHTALAEGLIPKWELGAGIGTVMMADYRGSKEYSSTTLPFPYLEYRGKYLKADREEGMRGQLFRSDSIEFNISADITPTDDTDDNPLRQGMPTLDPTFEIGTTLDFNLSGDTLSSGWLMRFPIRAVYTFGSGDINYIGWLAHPHLAYRKRYQEWNIRAYTGPLYGNNRYHDYYYTVAPEYARPGRPAYEASGGYSGYASGISATRRWGRFWGGAYIRYDNLSGATFEDSPLVETKNYYSVGIGMAWIFAAQSND